ncbi:MAG: cyclopropane-fatty-acyl-phospholipid synthase family protein [Cohaesibacter sp.]|nr:cyclopropane-fatty-acyl-phospholipid synthase family protein [Cohaesibacter sp.]MCV6601560.1 cyclopropane-fatty-acyl-phospholipid synthase family protein [Cohaesibacter sp.]
MTMHQTTPPPSQTAKSVGYQSTKPKTAGLTKSWLDKALSKLLKLCFGSLKYGHLIIHLPAGTLVELGPKTTPSHIVQIEISSYSVIKALLSAHPLALADSYIKGHWHCTDLTALFILFQKNRTLLDGLSDNGKLTGFFARLYHASRANTKKGSRRNIHDHYDLGNDFYALWLDPTMSYSSAYQLKGEQMADLEQAQKRKYEHILNLAHVPQNANLLEIGCGWGGMAEKAAQKGHKLHGVTLSKEQLTFAEQRLRNQHLSHLTSLSLTDYRDIEGKGQYDAIVSIEMLEAVGEENWPTYFAKIRDCLKPGGRAVVQVIVIADEHYEHYKKNVDFIQRYIFPGGFLPCPNSMKEQITAQGLKLEVEEYFASDYQATLHHWRKAFLKNWTAIKPLGFDERFKRVWNYYLCYCEAGFAEKSIDVGFFVIQKPDQ